MKKEMKVTGGSTLLSHLYRRITERNKSLVGRVLTIIDGAIVDKQQNKAVKDMISEAIYGSFVYRDIEPIIEEFLDKYCPSEKVISTDLKVKATYFNK